jgi:hypothetical protein
MNLATFTAAVMFLGTIPQDTGIVRDRVCCLEVNHFHDKDDAREVFVQLLAWEFCEGCERIVDWRLVKRNDEGQANIEVQRDYRTGEHVARWLDGETFREVRAETYRETFTNWDRELQDREHHPLDRRRKLTSQSRAK